MPLVQTRGAASAQGFGEFAQAVAVNYIEEVFSTYLYTGTGNAETITNGLNLSGKGGLVWVKSRSNTGNNVLNSNTSGGTTTAFNLANTTWIGSSNILDFLSNGFTIKADFGTDGITLGRTYCTWAFRKQAKFFDVVTYTGTGSNTTIPHSLGSVPGCIIVKSTSGPDVNWAVYHRSLANTQYLVLNSTAAAATGATWWNSTTPTSSVFSVGTDATVNANIYGQTYVAHLFAHDAGGFGLTGTDNVISCGSYTGNGSATGPVVTLGYEPQWLLVKQSSASGNDWILVDNMRGFPVTGNTAYLNPNNSFSESSFALVSPLATGFQPRTTDAGYNGNGSTYIYIAIRRGPMKVPTVGTSVFSPNIWSGTGTTQQITTGFFPDMFIGINRGAVHASTYATDTLRGLGVTLATNLTDAENSESGNTFNMTGYSNNNGNLNSTFGGGQTYVGEFFRRAPSFFDEVCYTGTGSALTVTHNLSAVPEIIIIKRRSAAASNNNWYTGWNMSGSTYMESLLNTTDAGTLYTYPNWFTSTPTTTTFAIAGGGNVNANTATYVAYLFATCAGVSKVGSYTGNGTTQTVNCGFTGGARFVLIKATSTTGNWLTFDTARGMTVLTDPFLSLNSTAAETATLGACTTVSTGFAVNESILAGVNTSSVSYIFLSVA